MITAINRDGTGKGFDLQLTRTIAKSVPVPVIACGGAGGVEDVHQVVQEGEAVAVSLASVLHYNFLRRYNTDDDFSAEGNIEHLRTGQGFTQVDDISLRDIKEHLVSVGIDCRPSGAHASHA